MRQTQLKIRLMVATLLAAISLPSLGLAAEYEIPHQFSSGDKARASEVNENFDAARSAISDNHARISHLETQNAVLLDEIESLKTQLSTLLGNQQSNAENISQNRTNLTKIQANSVLALDKLLSLETDQDGHPTAVFSSVNVQITNGDPNKQSVSATEQPNGLGNLIIGFNEKSPSAAFCDFGNYLSQFDCENAGYNWSTEGLKTGSHNLVLGPYHNYTRFGGLIAGSSNLVTNDSATVSGGASNRATGLYSTVSAGQANNASGNYSSVSGGEFNRAEEVFSSVSGGNANWARAAYSSVSGGARNRAEAAGSSISGGYENHGQAQYSSVSGGQGNYAEAQYSSVNGGSNNRAQASYSTVSGGFFVLEGQNYGWASWDIDTRLSQAERDIVGLEAQTIAGLSDYVSVTQDANGYDTIVFSAVNIQIDNGNAIGKTIDQKISPNGLGNLILGFNEAASVAPGVCHYDNGDRIVNSLEECTLNNPASAWWALQKSGSHNLIIGPGNYYQGYASLVTGQDQASVANAGAIISGSGHLQNADYSLIAGGLGNTSYGLYSSSLGGRQNAARGTYSSIMGGTGNDAQGQASSISGGENNTVTQVAPNGSISGGEGNWVEAPHASVSGGEANRAIGPHASVSGGQFNTASGQHSSISAGKNNSAGHQWSSISGGYNHDSQADYWWVTARDGNGDSQYGVDSGF